jgi:hypothetical protein
MLAGNKQEHFRVLFGQLLSQSFAEEDFATSEVGQYSRKMELLCDALVSFMGQATVEDFLFMGESLVEDKSHGILKLWWLSKIPLKDKNLTEGFCDWVRAIYQKFDPDQKNAFYKTCQLEERFNKNKHGIAKFFSLCISPFLKNEGRLNCLEQIWSRAVDPSSELPVNIYIDDAPDDASDATFGDVRLTWDEAKEIVKRLTARRIWDDWIPDVKAFVHSLQKATNFSSIFEKLNDDQAWVIFSCLELIDEEIYAHMKERLQVLSPIKLAWLYKQVPWIGPQLDFLHTCLSEAQLQGLMRNPYVSHVTTPSYFASLIQGLPDNEMCMLRFFLVLPEEHIKHMFSRNYSINSIPAHVVTHFFSLLTFYPAEKNHKLVTEAEVVAIGKNFADYFFNRKSYPRFLDQNVKSLEKNFPGFLRAINPDLMPYLWSGFCQSFGSPETSCTLSQLLRGDKELRVIKEWFQKRKDGPYATFRVICQVSERMSNCRKFEIFEAIKKFEQLCFTFEEIFQEKCFQQKMCAYKGPLACDIFDVLHETSLDKEIESEAPPTRRARFPYRDTIPENLDEVPFLRYQRSLKENVAIDKADCAIFLHILLKDLVNDKKWPEHIRFLKELLSQPFSEDDLDPWSDKISLAMQFLNETLGQFFNVHRPLEALDAIAESLVADEKQGALKLWWLGAIFVAADNKRSFDFIEKIYSRFSSEQKQEFKELIECLKHGLVLKLDREKRKKLKNAMRIYLLCIASYEEEKKRLQYLERAWPRSDWRINFTLYIKDQLWISPSVYWQKNLCQFKLTKDEALELLNRLVDKCLKRKSSRITLKCYSLQALLLSDIFELIDEKRAFVIFSFADDIWIKNHAELIKEKIRSLRPLELKQILSTVQLEDYHLLFFHHCISDEQLTFLVSTYLSDQKYLESFARSLPNDELIIRRFLRKLNDEQIVELFKYVIRSFFTSLPLYVWPHLMQSLPKSALDKIMEHFFFGFFYYKWDTNREQFFLDFLKSVDTDFIPYVWKTFCKHTPWSTTLFTFANLKRWQESSIKEFDLRVANILSETEGFAETDEEKRKGVMQKFRSFYFLARNLFSNELIQEAMLRSVESLEEKKLMLEVFKGMEFPSLVELCIESIRKHRLEYQGLLPEELNERLIKNEPKPDARS